MAQHAPSHIQHQSPEKDAGTQLQQGGLPGLHSDRAEFQRELGKSTGTTFNFSVYQNGIAPGDIEVGKGSVTMRGGKEKGTINVSIDVPGENNSVNSKAMRIKVGEDGAISLIGKDGKASHPIGTVPPQLAMEYLQGRPGAENRLFNSAGFKYALNCMVLDLKMVNRGVGARVEFRVPKA